VGAALAAILAQIELDRTSLRESSCLVHASDAPHSRTLRIGRLSEPNRIYAVTSCTLDRRPIFRDFYLGRILVGEFKFQQEHARAVTLAYVVMPDHFHWLMQLLPGSKLSAVVQSVKGRAASRINRLTGAPGYRLWQPGFHDHAVRREEDLAALARYIVGNPVRAGLARSVADYALWDSVWVAEWLDLGA
jgi:REP element-mobilizing transposase RayT